MKTVPADVPLVEKDFYLKEFRSKSLLFVLRVADLVSLRDRRSVEDVLSALVRNETRTLLLLETDGTAEQQRCIEALYQQCTQALKSTLPTPTVLSPEAEDDQLLIQAWEVLRTVPIFIGLWPEQANVSFLLCAQRLAIRLKVYKLVLLDQQGGLTSDREPMSFLNGPTLKVLQSRIENIDGYVERRLQLETAWRALEGGVSSVSLCAPSHLARELFTYEGRGTLFTLTDYCRVERLALDDFYEVERLIQRGEREGYLKSRTPYEVSLLLLHGYGARLGKERDLVGFCALLPYRAENAGEILGLYTLTRFQGEGIGSRLVMTAITEGCERHFAYLFACTNQEGAQRLFERFDFDQVGPDEVPAEKWEGYAEERRRNVTVYKREL